MPQAIQPIYISHGGGPLPILGEPGHAKMVECLQTLATKLSRPDVIIIVSAHWEEPLPTITGAPHPDLIYDYYGFPEESYAIQYPCPGAPAVADAIHHSLTHAGFTSRIHPKRGFDHGVFIPLKIMYPDADIPCVQVSLLRSLDPQSHIAMGEALAALSIPNALLIGSGASSHNLQAYFSQTEPFQHDVNHAFQQWLSDTCCNAAHSTGQRREKLIRWTGAPGARYAHPREEHLLPLHVCFGAAGGAPAEAINLSIMGTESRMYVW